MNGLKHIRKVCNYSLSNLAKEIGVSRQIISSWENGVSNIPPKRAEQLSSVFAIDGKYFSELNEEDKRELLNKPIYFRRYGAENHFSFMPDDECSLACHYNDSMSVKEKYDSAIKKMNSLLERVKCSILYNDSEKQLDKILSINRGESVFGGVCDAMENMKTQTLCDKMQYYYVILNVVTALDNALTGYKKEYHSLDNTEQNTLFQLEETIKEMYYNRKSLILKDKTIN